MLPIMMSLFACSDYSFDEGKPFNPGQEEEEQEVEPSENPDILIEPSLTDFGFVLKDCPAGPMDITITNIGLGDLDISSIDLSGDGNSSFSITHDGSPITLAYEETYTFGVYFLPTLYRDYDINLDVTSNDPEDAVASADVIGIGAEGSQYEESFTQDFNDAVDVLWVVDTSSSMDDNIQNVKNNFASFLGSFLSLGLDYQMAIVTTDMSDNGTFQGSPTIMTTSMGESTVTQTFNQTLDALGTTGSTTEKGLDVTHAALTNNPSFVRGGDVGLSVIIISDEDDNGSSLRGQNFINWFQGLNSDQSLVRMSAFLSVGDILGNAIYEEVIQATQGHIADIDSASYQQPLEEISLAAAGMTVTFPLTQTPATLSSITVTVDGNTVSQDLYTGWTYDDGLNAITFHGDSIPEVGDDVFISYMMETECSN
jgi:hypothetical protein